MYDSVTLYGSRSPGHGRSVSHSFLTLTSFSCSNESSNQRPQQLLLNALLGSKFHNVRSHIVLERKTYGWARLLEAEDSFVPELNTMCVPVVNKNVALSLNDWYENVCHHSSAVCGGHYEDRSIFFEVNRSNVL